MRKLAVLFLLLPFIALWIVACDGGSPSAPEATPETAPLFGKVPTNPTACYTAGMAALEAAETYGEAAKVLAKCDQAAQGPCDIEQQAHADAWTVLMAAYDAAVTACGGGTPPTGDQDGDGVLDAADSCPTGETGWTSDGSTDFDGDGCRDAGEDLDDDNDGVLDVGDDCPLEPGSADNNGCPSVCTEDSQCGACEICTDTECVFVVPGEDPKDDCPSITHPAGGEFAGYCNGTGGCTFEWNAANADYDDDGYTWDGIGGQDCDDTDPNVNPGILEDYYTLCEDGIDNNCDGIDSPCLPS